MRQSASQIRDAAAAIQTRWKQRPRVGVILGSGLAGLTDLIQTEASCGYEAIPHFPRATALGHPGRLVCGTLMGSRVIVMQGRFHLYEGYRPSQTTLPVRVMQLMGIEVLIVSNASGGLNPHYRSGDVVVIEDQINLMFANPLIGSNDESWGPRFPDMSAPFDPDLRDRSLAVARAGNFVLHTGVYAALPGPNYETRAEYRLLRRIGADLVGMSTVPEVLVARHAGIRVLALSAVTNLCRPDASAPTSGAAVVAAAQSTEHKMRDIVCGVVQSLH